MGTIIRLTQIGKKNSPSYRIVVNPVRSKRDGECLDTLGFYNPTQNPPTFEYDKQKYKEWVDKGAKVSPAVKSIIEGKYKFTKYDPKKLEAAKEAHKKPSEKVATAEE